MVELGLSERPGLDLPLEDRATKGGSEGAPRLNERLVIGLPSTLTLTEDRVSADEELRNFIAEERNAWTYHLVTFTCTFVHDEKLPLQSAWVRYNSSPTTATPRLPRQWRPRWSRPASTSCESRR